MLFALADGAAEIADGRAGEAVAVAIYNPELDGGASCGETGMIEALKEMEDIAASPISDLSSERLAKFQVLIVPDPYRLGKGGKDWQESLPKFAKAGGGILYSFHCPAMRPERKHQSWKHMP